MFLPLQKLTYLSPAIISCQLWLKVVWAGLTSQSLSHNEMMMGPIYVVLSYYEFVSIMPGDDMLHKLSVFGCYNLSALTAAIFFELFYLKEANGLNDMDRVQLQLLHKTAAINLIDLVYLK